MKKIGRGVLKLVERAVSLEITENVKSWPPHCSGIFHQPRRPDNSVKCTKSEK